MICEVKRVAVGVVLVLLSVIFPRLLFARQFPIHGTSCKAGFSPDGIEDNAQYSQYGINTPAENGSFPLKVACELPISYPVTPTIPVVTEVHTLAYDRSSVSDVTCQLLKVNFAGNVLFSAFVHTTGGAAGSAVQDLIYPVPAGTAVDGYWSVFCTIPPIESLAISHVVATVISTSE